MKKLVLVLLSIALFTSCKFKEEITFNEDGSGTYDLVVDMSGLMAMGKGMEKAMDSIGEKREPIVKDSIIKISDILAENKDSIAKLPKEEQEALKRMKDFVIKIHTDEPNEEMTMSYSYPFKNIKDLNYAMEHFEAINKMQKKDSSSPLSNISSGMPKNSVKYKFSKHQFLRIATETETDKEKEEKENKEFEQMGNMIQFELVYHFPKRIKSVSYKDALLSADGKTLHINIPVSKMSDPDFMNLKVTFE